MTNKLKLESTTGTLFISSILKERGPQSFMGAFRLTRNHFADVELKLIDLIQNYIDLYKAVPDKNFVEIEIGAELPDPPTAGTVSFWADEVRKRYAVENSYVMCRDILSRITEGDIDSAADAASRMTRILIEGQTKTRVYSLEDVYDSVLESHDQARLNSTAFGIPFGIDFLDRSSGGAQGGDLITVAARPGCLSGDTVLPICRDKGYRYTKISLRTLYYKFNGLDRPEASPMQNRKWKTTKPVYTLSCNKNGRVRRNRIKNVVYSGAKQVYRVVTESGKDIKATADHRFLIDPLGGGTYLPLSKLDVGDTVICHFHGTDGRVSVKEKIIMLEKAGIQETYDVEMEKDPRNFMAGGFFVHNSGKTFLLLHMALSAYGAGKNVMLIPTEMSEIQYHRRLAALRNTLSINKIKFGELSSVIGVPLLKYDKELLEKNEHKFYMTDASMSLGMLDVKSSAYVYKPDAIYIDGAYLLRPETYAKSRYEMVSSVAESLKMLAKELNIPIIATYQINKKTDDIYQSDVVRQLSSIVIELADKVEEEGEAWVPGIKPKVMSITKGRDGEEGNTLLLLDTNHTRVVERDPDTGEENEGDRCNSPFEIDGV